MPTVTVIEHEASCPTDRFGPWLEDRGLTLDVVRPYLAEEVPAAVDVEALLVLGGEMGAYDDEVAPWLPTVRALLQAAVATAVPTLGICLGAQLLAVAAGGRVERGSAGSERGVIDVRWTAEAASDALVDRLPQPFPTPAMHDDAVVDLPPGAVLLGGTQQYPHQAFRVGDAAWGVQFHPEVRPETLIGWTSQLPPAESAAMAATLHARDAEVVDAARSLAHRFATVVTARRPTSRD